MTRVHVAVAALLACGVVAAESIDLSSPELVADGAEVFAQSCAVGYCHGSEGRAARGPALRDRIWDPRDLYRITAEGLPGTSMPGWQNVVPDLSIWAVTAYLMSLSSAPPSGSSAIVESSPEASSPQRDELSQDALRGKDLFFDLTREGRCGVCHEIEGFGSAIGPNLLVAAKAKSSGGLKRDILEPEASIAYGFEQVWLELESGEEVAGVLAEETDTVVRLYDSASVPPPLRSVAKRSIRRQATRNRSSMPADLGQVYSDGEIDLIVAFLAEAAR